MNVALLAADPVLGGAGTLRAHAAELAAGPCVLVAATGPVRVDLDSLLRAHAVSGALLTVAVRTRREGDAAMDVLIADDDGRVMGVQSAPHPDEALSELVDAGLYAVSPEALHHIGPPPAHVGADLLPALLTWDAPVRVYRLDS